MLEKLLNWINRHLLLLIGLIAVWRIGFLAFNGLDLLGDESYYWDWSRQPDWCYYSKPPMVAWLIGGFTWLLGDYTFTVRLPAVVLGSVFLAYFYATAKAFYGQRAAALALLLMVATPINLLANFLMTIDPPLYCFWIMSLYYLRRAVFDQQDSAWWLAGLSSAAALLSKQVAIALPLMLLLYLILDSKRRHYLTRQYLYYLVPIMLVSVQILLWNQQHDWVMFGHSKSHFGQELPLSFIQHLQQTAEFFLYQALLISPLILGLVLILSLKQGLVFKQLTAEQRFLWLMGPFLLLAIMGLSVAQKVQGNWPMPFYFSALILLAGYCQQANWKNWLKFAMGLGYLMVAITCVLPLLLQALNWQHSALDPTKRFKNWQQLALSIHQQRLTAMPELADTFVVALGHRFVASQMAFYLPDHPQVFRLESSGQISSQYEVWPGPAARFKGKNAFVIAQTDLESLPAELMSAFSRVKQVAEIANPNLNQAPYYLYLAENLQSWPTP